ncbi:MAG: 4-(cytidine 5'-diphospho)-2-C-methyl-D-erythritol kinase [Deltaproteobacteria bacterium]|nr:4-(cytidine 5'-diphospho)-2-C-methyl-D-erythritol kinase [Deltaproteobacteria bacterium]
MVKVLRRWAPAKINLFLRVIGRRANGYHELDSLFLPISLYDGVDIELRSADSSTVELSCDSEAIPAGERNLAFRAALEFMAEFRVRAQVLIKLHKEIPAGAGLGGGSSDAGAVLQMMARLCGIGPSAALDAVAMRLGADVPFFLSPTPSRVRGIGERIEPLAEMKKPFLVIAIPPIEVLTALVFRELRPEQWSGPAPDEDVRAIVRGRFEPHHLVNDLEQVATAKWPEIGELKQLLAELGARAAAMTGSGAGVFGIFASATEACCACQQIERRVPHVQAFSASGL